MLENKSKGEWIGQNNDSLLKFLLYYYFYNFSKKFSCI